MKNLSLYIAILAVCGSISAGTTALADMRSALEAREFDKAAAAYTAALDNGITQEQFAQAGISVTNAGDNQGGVCFKLTGFDTPICEGNK